MNELVEMLERIAEVLERIEKILSEDIFNKQRFFIDYLEGMKVKKNDV